jgi:Fe-S-cluster containining protein
MNEVVNQSLSECKRCGTCCIKGGPSLHFEDKDLLTNGSIKHEHLVTIRKGEMAHIPLCEEPAPLTQELIKIGGKGKDWECTFFDRDQNLCTIYEHRPLECRLLECWNTSALEDVVGQDTLTRADIIDPDNPIGDFIRFHELKCPVPAPDRIRLALSSEGEGPEVLAGLTELVHRDLAVRAEAVGRFHIPLPLEILYFGRPIHIMLHAYGLSAIENDGIIQITVQEKKL